MVRVLNLHLCDSGSNPTFGSFFFFFFFACHEFVTVILKGLKYSSIESFERVVKEITVELFRIETI